MDRSMIITQKLMGKQIFHRLQMVKQNSKIKHFKKECQNSTKEKRTGKIFETIKSTNRSQINSHALLNQAATNTGTIFDN